MARERLIPSPGGKVDFSIHYEWKKTEEERRYVQNRMQLTHVA